MPAVVNLSSSGLTQPSPDINDNPRLESSIKQTESIEEVMAAVNGATSKLAQYEYTPIQRTRPPTLAEIVGLYPIMEVLATQLVDIDLLSLSLVSKEIHELLGQTTSSTYWKLLYSKSRPLECEKITDSRRACYENPKRCIGCRNGMCARYGNTLDLLYYSADKRIRYVCRHCIIYGRDPRLSESPTLFRKHTLNQLTAARNWADENHAAIDPSSYSDLHKAQKMDWTFCPARADLFSIGRFPPLDPSGAFYPPQNLTQEQGERMSITTWQTIPSPSTYDPKRDRVREHNTSRCVCLQAGLSIPLCHDCTQIGIYNDYKYIDFARHNSGSCECGTMLIDFPGGKEGETIPGANWVPERDTISLYDSKLAANCNDTAEQGNSHKPRDETIQGLCGWCGFRIYEQREKGKLPMNEYEFQLLQGGMTAPEPA